MRAILLCSICTLLSNSALGQNAGENPVQYWLDKGRDAYQAYLSCLTKNATDFASQTCAAPSDIFEASQSFCTNLEPAFALANKKLSEYGIGTPTTHEYLLEMTRPDVNAAILTSQIKHGCK